MGIYVNRTLNLKKIKAIGLDMDYTLVRYHTEAFEKQTYQMARECLITLKNYPKEILSIDFNFKRAIRGLVIDEKRGNLIKISLHGRIKKAAHGTCLLDIETQKKIYGDQIIDLGEKSFTPIDTSFSISHGVLFANLVDLKDQGSQNYPSYEEMAQDVLEMIDLIHRDNSLKSYVTKNMDQFIIQDQKIPEFLETFKSSGKKLFIVTNSPYPYTQKLLNYTLSPFLKDHHHWQDLFDIIITLAEKPQFFTTRQRFLKWDQQTQQLVNIDNNLTPGIFQGGNSLELQDYLGLESDEILYLGDHIYGDILTLKKQYSWRTALIIEEIDQEVATIRKQKDQLAFLNQLMLDKEKIEDEINRIINVKKEKNKAQSLLNQIKKIDEKLETTTVQYNAAFNSHWGEIMRAGAEESRFAGQVAKYACIYMAKVSDLASVSTRKYFRPKRRPLPHDYIDTGLYP